jgi:hypothetical protein
METWPPPSDPGIIKEELVMTVTLNLPPNIEQLFLAEAQARGLAVEEVIEEALLAARQPVKPSEQLSPEEWMRRFKEWSESPAHANLPVLSDYAMSRESIYEDRGL